MNRGNFSQGTALRDTSKVIDTATQNAGMLVPIHNVYQLEFSTASQLLVDSQSSEYSVSNHSLNATAYNFGFRMLFPGTTHHWQERAGANAEI